MSEKINLLNLNQQELEELVISLGMKNFMGSKYLTGFIKK